MSVVIVDYEAGNLRSVESAFSWLQEPFLVTAEPEEILRADRLVLPGVGEARAAMTVLEARGLIPAIREFISRGNPFLGICLGSQIILEESDEGDAPCLGLLEGRAVAFDPRRGLKIPHMGWNTITPRGSHPFLGDLSRESSFYFVHSFFPSPRDPGDVLAWCDYGDAFAAVVGRENIVATQFHPEKSGEAGLRLLRNFLQWKP
ncbi:imidazole glycerol phosphate synthase subunit HisH [Alkalispirochaeta sphaeroplastigenens]|uniref:Imidazole glycerol phosphate synthase subunit HisH n=1 Tax=Alkalispirochaeta sphaeroplastigenens TaxID=1187066 RepID=A0A2S4JQJ6_9SPIO|nr:imidazole glycerol phosphate synthase subunit HisH [Alkalispirochaeta sphaeroplastigenens]POR01814.1 imidazole glycerol phosphate synthase subunit HisH [Alkalispirochaeta sphaeroplastigenens]